MSFPVILKTTLQKSGDEMNAQQRAAMQQGKEALEIAKMPEGREAWQDEAILDMRKALAAPALPLTAPVTDDEIDAAFEARALIGDVISVAEMKLALEGFAAGRAAWVEPAVVEQTRWISIDKQLPAPATPVLVTRGKKVLRACHAPKFTLSEDAFGEFEPKGEYDPVTDMSYWPEGWYEWNENEETHWALDSAPSHWQALPAPADAKGGKP
ncbi:MAG: DUF551 domain-containing protein [Polaromonas sp.]|uniref:DUF551 domain-containing protein n=1 Tax=Polaromonas sp. TaxID=1869339 RepID=UPI00272FFF34|nr:DUF551 domain-containing protein [Polaromonas sp.]MDP2255450.1 DUF551 domain-containing protein [Polaromonas sp.]